MEAPHNVTFDMFNQLVDTWLEEHADVVGTEIGPDGQSHLVHECRKCSTKIVYLRSFLSVHEPGWGHCVGYGQVINPTIPCCPKCEPRVDVFGCVHREEEKSIPMTSWFKNFSSAVKNMRARMGI